MDRRPERYPIRFDSRLVEDAVLLAEPGLHPLLRLRFRRERDALYRLEDLEERDLEFALLHQRWFGAMELGEPLALAIREHWGLVASTNRCLVLPAVSAGDEDADLREERPAPDTDPLDRGHDADGRLTIVIRVRSKTIAERAAFQGFLDHEFLHVADMLDPGFGYCAELPALEGGPARLRQAQNRYRVLWDCTIDGRLHRQGKVPPELVRRRRQEFEASFPELGAAIEPEFQRWFEGPRPTHDEILRASCNSAPRSLSGICPLCRFPYPSLNTAAASTHGILAEIRADFPSWSPEHGICIPCVDLYQARLVDARP